MSACTCYLQYVYVIVQKQAEKERRDKNGGCFNMKKIGIFLADSCEEIEALTVVDIVRRAKFEIVLISVTGKKEITGSHNIHFQAEELAEEVDYDALDGIVLPGGMPGTTHLLEHAKVNEVIRKFASDGKLVAAICAAPSVLGAAGLLEGKHATCHPGWEEKLTGAIVNTTDTVVRDGNIITSRGMGTAVDFGLAIASYFTDEATVEHVKAGLVY